METKKYIDLHTHSVYSDGELSPAQVARAAAFKGTNIWALTDHDSMKGIQEASYEAEKLGMKFIPGVEITTPDYHLLTLNPDTENKRFQEFIQYSGQLQMEACKARAEIIYQTGIPITIEKVVKEFPDSRLGKWNLFITMLRDPDCRGEILVKHPGKTLIETKNYYIGKGGIASDLKDRPAVSDEEAIKEVHLAGGIVGIAHPPKDIKRIEDLDRLVALGIDFIEIQPLFKEEFPYHIYEEYAREHNMPVSYGSDYHGPSMDRQLLKKNGNIMSNELERMLMGTMKSRGIAR